jgi:hypothetical protein
LVLYLVNLFLIHPAFLLTLEEINPFDEAAYINSGRLFLEGNLPSFAGNPLVDAFYALTYIPFRNSTLWLVQSAFLGRLLLFSLLWLSVYLIARQLARWAQPMLMVGLLLVTPLAVDMLRFPSDPLFAGLAGLSLWQLLRYQESLENTAMHGAEDQRPLSARRHLLLASTFLGLAALARNDGLVLFIIFIFLVLLLNLRRPRWWAALFHGSIPFLLLVGGYVLVYGLATGDFSLGTAERTYLNFEAGQQSIYAGTGALSPVVESRLEAQRIFGTGKENNYSILRAIRRNPQVYLHRVLAVTKELPTRLLRAYGIRFAALLFLLAGRGLLGLARRRQYALLAILALWPAHLATGFVITIFREGHLAFPFYVVYALAAIGLHELLANLQDRREVYFWTAALLGLSAYGIWGNKLAVYYGAAVFLVGLGVIWLIAQRPNVVGPLRTATLFILLCAGLVIRGGFPTPSFPALRETAKAQASLYMIEHLAPGTKVAAGSPGVVWSARMTYASLTSPDVPQNKSSAEFLDWMIRQDIRAIYVDHSLYNTNPFLWDLIKGQLGQGIERVFAADDGDIQVLILNFP